MGRTAAAQPVRYRAARLRGRRGKRRFLPGPGAGRWRAALQRPPEALRARGCGGELSWSANRGVERDGGPPQTPPVPPAYRPSMAAAIGDRLNDQLANAPLFQQPCQGGEPARLQGFERIFPGAGIET